MFTIEQENQSRYLVIDADAFCYESFEIQTLNRDLDALLEMEHINFNGKNIYRYALNNLYTADEYLKSEVLNPEEAILLFKNIVNSFYHLCRYMLSPDRICLSADTIFVSRYACVKMLYLPESKSSCNSKDYQNSYTRARDAFKVLLTRFMSKFPNVVTGGQTVDALLESILSETNGYTVDAKKSDIGAASKEVLKEVVAEKGVQKVKDIHKERLKLIFLLIAIQCMCVLLMIGGSLLLSEITGDLLEAQYAWGCLVLGIDLLCCYLLVGKKTNLQQCTKKQSTLKPEGMHEKRTLIENETMLLREVDKHQWAFFKENQIVFKWLGDQVLVGRNHAIVQWYIDEAEVGRQHAQMHLCNGELILRDLGSKNGTFVNGRDIRDAGEMKVFDGDVLTFSHLSFELRDLNKEG